MAIFHLAQFEHEPFWQHLFRLNDYHTQYVHFMYEKGERCKVALEGITYKTWATLGLVCYGGLCSFNVDDVWDLLESLSLYQWQCEYVSESFGCPSPPPYDLHAQYPCVYQVTDVMSSPLFLPSWCMFLLPIHWPWCEFLSLLWCMWWIICPI